ncbi:hypothetical protein [Anabaenopsis arnoldii]|uniref:hypothetical protein n=1 Tax=Anabaenopsis arnoldii TaxID=2152938 RepID=UPI0024769133|nr:hypothetical protein [Anabaenopsis arnoldii]MDH6091798.1 hypothetical protein [Anabaenopsis arnoldii]
MTKFFNFEQMIGGHTHDFTSVDDTSGVCCYSYATLRYCHHQRSNAQYINF